MDQTRIWEHFQAGEGTEGSFAHAGERYRFLARHAAPGERVLTVGVGRGGLEALLVARGATLSCLDPVAASIADLRARFSLGERAQVGRCRAMPFPDASFDLVVMSEVLEHLDDGELARAVDEAARVLAAGGRVIGTVPAQEILAEGRVACPHCARVFHRWGHQQSFDRARLAGLLGGRLAQVRVSRRFFTEGAALNWKGRLACLAKRTLIRLGVPGKGETFFFSGLRRPSGPA